MSAAPSAPAMVANVLFPERHEQLLEQMGDALRAGRARAADGFVWFDAEGYLPVWDEDDEGSGPLFVMYAAEDAGGATVYAPDCADVSELERRVYRDLAADFTIDDHGEAVA